MKASVHTSGLTETIRALSTMGKKVRPSFVAGAEKTGQQTVELIKSRYREGGRGPNDLTRTAVRSGLLRRSYTSRVSLRGRNQVLLDVGVLQPVAGKTLKYARIHEGGDRIDNLRPFTVIRPKRAHQVNYVTRSGKAVSFSIKALHFPIRSGAGNAQANIKGWRFAKEVTIPARPALFREAPKVPQRLHDNIMGELNDLLNDVWR